MRRRRVVVEHHVERRAVGGNLEHPLRPGQLEFERHAVDHRRRAEPLVMQRRVRVLVAGDTAERVAVYLAANGCEVTAVDVSSDVLERVMATAGAARSASCHKVTPKRRSTKRWKRMNAKAPPMMPP